MSSADKLGQETLMTELLSIVNANLFLWQYRNERETVGDLHAVEFATRKINKNLATVDVWLM